MIFKHWFNLVTKTATIFVLILFLASTFHNLWGPASSMLWKTRALFHIQERCVWPLSTVSPNSLSDTTVLLITPLKRSHQASLALQTIFSPMVLPNLKTKWISQTELKCQIYCHLDLKTAKKTWFGVFYFCSQSERITVTFVFRPFTSLCLCISLRGNKVLKWRRRHHPEHSKKNL